MELQIIQNRIYQIRGLNVMLDFDLAEMYGVETKVLKQAVRRNLKRFPSADFMFELTKEEYDFLRSQFVTLENGGRGKFHNNVYLNGVFHCYNTPAKHQDQPVTHQWYCKSFYGMQ